MIPKAELLALRGEWSLSDEVIEKDYVLGWLLGGIAADPVLRDQWVFKGGTALRKCYFETYRFSEDLDFTVRPGGPEEPADLLPIFQRISIWLEDACGMRMVVDEASFKRRKNRRGNATTEGRLAYSGPRQAPGLPKVKLDLTSDELLAEPDAERPVSHPYSDAPSVASSVRCYSIAELLAEKLRALVERCRPRDLYDVIHLHRYPDLALDASKVRDLLARKCAFANVTPPTLASIHASPFRADLEQEWGNMLAHQLPVLPPLAQFWNTLDALFRWLEGTGEVSRPAPRLRPRPSSRSQLAPFTDDGELAFRCADRDHSIRWRQPPENLAGLPSRIRTPWAPRRGTIFATPCERRTPLALRCERPRPTAKLSRGSDRKRRDDKGDLHPAISGGVLGHR